MGTLREDEELRNRTEVFQDREDAGLRLAAAMEGLRGSNGLVLAIPSGGVPVGRAIAASLALDMDLLIVRKVQIPWNTEAGFGAANLDGDVLFNEPLLARLNLVGAQIRFQVQQTIATINRRETLFRKGRPFPLLHGRQVILADDGLASGYTMQVAINYVKKRHPDKIIVAVPTASADTVQKILPEVDTLFCLNVREGYSFAVASAYRKWHDLEDDEVLRLVSRSSLAVSGPSLAAEP